MRLDEMGVLGAVSGRTTQNRVHPLGAVSGRGAASYAESDRNSMSCESKEMPVESTHILPEHMRLLVTAFLRQAIISILSIFDWRSIPTHLTHISLEVHSTDAIG